MTVIFLCLFVLSILIVCLIFVHAQNHDSNSNKTAGNAKTDKSTGEEIQNDEEIPMAGETQNNEEIQNAEETQDIENSDMTVDNDLEQRAKDINKAAGVNLIALAQTLGCKAEDLMEQNLDEIEDEVNGT